MREEDNNSRLEVQRHTVIGGIILGLLWSIGLFQTNITSIAILIQIVSIPLPIFVLYKLATKFRDEYHPEAISFGASFKYCMFIITWGTILFGLAVYFNFKLNPEILTEIKNVSEEIFVNMYGSNDKMIEESIDQLDRLLVPSTLGIYFAIIYTFVGVFISLILSAIIKRDNITINHQE